jgi:hypothetical protein
MTARKKKKSWKPSEPEGEKKALSEEVAEEPMEEAPAEAAPVEGVAEEAPSRVDGPKVRLLNPKHAGAVITCSPNDKPVKIAFDENGISDFVSAEVWEHIKNVPGYKLFEKE